MSSLRLDFYITTGLVILATIFTTAFNLSFIVSTVLFFAVPALYLFIRKPRPLNRISLASLFFGLILMFEMDFLAELNHVWIVPEPLFGKLFGITTIDILLWSLLWVFFVVVFYEHFFEHEKGGKISPNFIFGALPALSVLIVILTLYALNPEILKFDYAYLILGTSSFIPFAIPAIRRVAVMPSLAIRFVKTASFFFFVHLAHEVTAIKLGQWYFPGQFIGYVEFADIRFPVEEFVFWVVLSTAILLAEYEYFIDDRK